MVWRLLLVIVVFVLGVIFVAAQHGPSLEVEDPVVPRASQTALPLGGKGDRIAPAPGWQFTAAPAAPQAKLPVASVPMPPPRPGRPDVGAVCAARGLKIWVRIDGVRYACPPGG
jgi:hypothetical protein